MIVVQVVEMGVIFGLSSRESGGRRVFFVYQHGTFVFPVTPNLTVEVFRHATSRTWLLQSRKLEEASRLAAIAVILSSIFVILTEHQGVGGSIVTASMLMNSVHCQVMITLLQY